VLWFFLFFLVSGFCSVLYEIVWLRLAMAQFGVTSAMVSIVLSFFMAGLGLGSWLSGRLIRKYGNRAAIPALQVYAITEFLIGTSSLLVPQQLVWGRNLLEHTGLSSSGAFYLVSGLFVALTLIPWCACMGATIPVAMLAIRRGLRTASPGSFSYLYLSNVLGAVGGALVPPLLVELFGFRGTLSIGMMLNYLLSLSAFALSSRTPELHASTQMAESAPRSWPVSGDVRILMLLFATGLTSMGMEVVWIRQFTPYLGTMVYSFAVILAIYLVGTFLGSRVYRWRMGKDWAQGRLTWALLGLSALLPLVAADPSFGQKLSSSWAESWASFAYGAMQVLVGIGPFSAALGFITPMLIDRWSGDNPDRAGRAYAVNVLGCIAGPLLSGFLLLPYLSEHWVVCLLSLPWFLMAIYPVWPTTKQPATRARNAIAYALLGVAMLLVTFTSDFQQRFPRSLVLRDNTATVIAYGEGRQKRLLVNGVGMTGLTQITKMMAHIPLAFLDHQPQNALTICFGMGTSYRSLLSWGIPVTAIELVPSVPKTLGYFHADAQKLLSSPRSRIVIDDGRRYLERSSERYDVIIVDPPPPVSAAASSLLYSKEFYSVIRPRLAPGGILQQWLPAGDPETRVAVTRALLESFPYVRLFAYDREVGYHFLASDRPIPDRTPEELVQRMPAAAVKDMMEWLPDVKPERLLLTMLLLERSPAEIVAISPHTPALWDDRPINEYFLIRYLRWKDGTVLNSSLATP
jgi:predicted membrane-bound spermidine synthase